MILASGGMREAQANLNWYKLEFLYVTSDYSIEE